VLAFAMQDTPGNFAAGLMITVYRSFGVGGHAEVVRAAGRVDDVSIVSTTITTPDNRVVVIPDNDVWGSVITNATGSDVRRVDLAFSVGCEADRARPQRILEDVLAGHPQVLKEPAPARRGGSSDGR
jgi:small conductance mechanosensitive channel